jgi:hypothetical protein
MFGGEGFDQAVPVDAEESRDATAVFVVHGRDREAKEALWSFLKAIGLHPLDWEEDLVALTGQGTPYVGEILDAAFQRAQAVVVLITPDDRVMLHPDLVEVGEEEFEKQLTGQPRPNVLFEAGMAFGFNPTRTILVEIGRRRPVSDLGGRHTIRLGTADTSEALPGASRSRAVRSTESWIRRGTIQRGSPGWPPSPEIRSQCRRRTSGLSARELAERIRRPEWTTI